MTAHHRDTRVDAYIDALPEWQQAICGEVRELVHAAGAIVTDPHGILTDGHDNTSARQISIHEG